MNYMNKKPVCMCSTMIKTKNTTNFRILLILMSVNGEIHNAYNLYIITNTVTIGPRGNFTKERNNL